MDHGNRWLEGLDSLWSPCWMKKCLDFVFVSLCDLLGLKEHHFCLLLLAFLSTHPAVTNGGGSRLTVSLKSPALTPGEKTSGCFSEQHLLSPPPLHPQGQGLGLFSCFCHRCIGQRCTPPAVSIFCVTACLLRVMMLS